MNETDDVLEEIAAKLERPNFLDLAGVSSKRKRDREDAALRMKVRQEQRKELARWVRSFQSKAGNSYASTLAGIQNDRFAFGPDVAAAILAGHAKLKVSIALDAHLCNCAPVYEVELTEAGRSIANAREAAE